MSHIYDNISLLLHFYIVEKVNLRQFVIEENIFILLCHYILDIYPAVRILLNWQNSGSTVWHIVLEVEVIY